MRFLSPRNFKLPIEFRGAPPAHELSSIGVTCSGTEVNDGMKTSLKCHCGQRVLRRDVMQQGYYMRQFGPSYVYIKFRCSRCKKLGEHFVKQEEWEDGLLQEITTEVGDTERSRFSKLGTITLDEMKHFHRALETLDIIPDFQAEEKE